MFRPAALLLRRRTANFPQRQLSTSLPRPRAPIPIPNAPSAPPLPLPDAYPLELPRAISPTRALLLLSTPSPPTDWPSHLEMHSPLLAATSAKLKARGIGVNVVYDPAAPYGSLGFQGKKEGEEEEKFMGRLFWPNGRKIEWDIFNLETLNSDGLEKAINYTPVLSHSSGLPELLPASETPQKEILVCTHGSRDCRCADRGGPLVLALRKEVSRRGLQSQVKIGEVAHVGGHKYAANAILLPTMDMLSNLSTEHAPCIIDHLFALAPSIPSASVMPVAERGTKPDDSTHAKGGMWTHWRGRYGLTGEQQALLWDSVDPSRQLHIASTSHETAEKKEREIVTLRFKTYEGEEKVVQAQVGENLLEVGKKNDLPSLEGVCDGNLECATCHLYLSSSPAPPVSEPSEAEDDMLGYAIGYKEGESRLGCQIEVTKDLAKWCDEGRIIRLPRF
ncbi:hypothetical protein C366_02695 [Cryptococcus neoformans Tu401-1]|nr:hypothetical protein C366_02695 [Cryptococcus neoformans var. grubii Tu401-1]